jgi:hypothetical protein
MEETIKKYKQQISHKVDEILSLKSHIGSISDTLSGKFNEAKPSTATPDQPKDTIQLQTPRTLIPTNGRANSTVKKSTNIL